MPYMPPSEASFSLPCLLFAAITQGGVDEVGGLDIDVGDQGGSDSNLVKKCWGPGTPAPQWLADDHCTPHTHALIPTSRTPSPLRWQWMKQCFLMTVVVVAAAVFSDHMSCVIIFAERTVDFFQRTLVGSPLLEMTRLKLIPSNS